ncbi:MAG TPA: 16S rRNA (cytosine(967)-C(5))-methyltransferase RsmB [Dokdonella sp.]|nr:16S rRNA (cytosine(967)-C(5))-methyltransferase RsmB [Dokdonella sp.]HQW76020.1 16S rRNA (cytosine(967)-C(5))-methyltransferase RsmB [Dokdonella sp.]HQY55311.1 16S rRNA (cytosine(967)-C(5))-methyltransferase RsmB [Dokdonella sp.]HQZ62941.1 16S rRNA (cytosine(967)-C(5))-methyltransferase RsmB [Dokdonella sp.]
MSGAIDSVGAAIRADAARTLARIVFDGVSLRSAFDARAARSADPRDRALLSATLFSASRWWLRFDVVLARLLERALPAKAREIHALLVLGLVQIETMGMPEYAVVAACVDAARLLGQPRHAGLVNAVLRRYLRERAALLAAADLDAVSRHAHPRWMIERISSDWPRDAEAIFAANNCAAALTLRVNRRRSSPEDLIARLAAAGVVAESPAHLPDGLILSESTDVSRLPGFAEGHFSVQDGAAQQVVDLLDVAAGQRVLDACAAPGGKSAHILERAAVELTALDADAGRLPRLRENLARLGLSANVLHGDASRPPGWWDGKPFDRILLDAPCSASGIIRRQPDIKLHRRAADIAPLAAMQARLGAALWPMLAPGGKLLYATCSIFRAENEVVVAGLLDAHADARALPIAERHGRVAGNGRQNLPGNKGMDGFYYALVEKDCS